MMLIHLKNRTILFFFVLCFFGFSLRSGFAQNETGVDLGRRLLQEGDFQGALDAYRKELRLAFDNAELKQEFEVLQKVIRMREDLKNEENAIRWSILSDRLRRFYQQNDIHQPHIDLALELHRKHRSTKHAAYVIGAYVQAERYQEAVDFANSLERAASDPVIQIEKACIFIAAGYREKARTIARSISAKSLESPDDLLRLARLQAATQLHATAVKTLVRCFEQTPPTILAKVKKEASGYPEFAELLSASEFVAAMSTRSRISADDPACAKKWIGATIDERPWYIRNLSRREINYDDWRLAQ